MHRRGGFRAGYPSSPTAARTASTTAPDATNSTAFSISGERKRSVPGPSITSRRQATTAPVPTAGVSGARMSIARAAVSTSMANTRINPSTLRRSFLPADQPMDTWSSCIADDGIESALAGAALRFNSDTIAACVYCAIM